MQNTYIYYLIIDYQGRHLGENEKNLVREKCLSE